MVSDAMQCSECANAARCGEEWDRSTEARVATPLLPSRLLARREMRLYNVNRTTLFLKPSEVWFRIANRNSAAWFSPLRYWLMESVPQIKIRSQSSSARDVILFSSFRWFSPSLSPLKLPSRMCARFGMIHASALYMAASKLCQC